MSHIDLEEGNHHRNDTSPDGSLCFSDADEGSCYSMFYSTTGGSYDEYRFDYVSDPEIGRVSDSRRVSSASEYSIEVGIDGGGREIKVHLAKVETERDCRICHLSLEQSSHHESGIAIELGCSCKDDLAAAHKNCAEQWFKIKGNKTCEICNSLARNLVGANEAESTEHSNEAHNVTTSSAVSAPVSSSETRSLWQGHRFLNFMLACMVFAFVISWLFHFNVPS